MTRPAISILTPTCNRAHDSLNRQKTGDFEWVVADDNSTDCTPAPLAGWQAEAGSPIAWSRYGNNRGKNAVVNSGTEFVSGDTTLILDSDDALPDASNLAFRCVDEAGALVGRLGKEGETARAPPQASVWEARYRPGTAIESIGVMKTQICREQEFMELTGSEHCPESVTHLRMSQRYRTIIVDRPVRRYFQNDGVTRSSDKPSKAVKWPRGNYLRAVATLNDDTDRCPRNLRLLLNSARNITRLGLHIDRSHRLQLRGPSNARARLPWAAGMPGGLAGYARHCLRGRTASKADHDISVWDPAAPPGRGVSQ